MSESSPSPAPSSSPSSTALTAAVPELGDPPGGRPWVKICGVTCEEDALLAVDLGADFLGFNFYPPSPRYLTPEAARRIGQVVRDHAPQVVQVGVFVNAGADEVALIVDQVGLDLVQFHGDETPEDVDRFAERALKVFRVRDRFDAAALESWRGVWGFLVDSRHPHLYGGSGESWDFSSLRDASPRIASRDRVAQQRLFIAGGLDPGNIRRAVAEARPWGVDLCSGVESRPGIKDPERMRQLFEEIDHGESRPPT